MPGGNICLCGPCVLLALAAGCVRPVAAAGGPDWATVAAAWGLSTLTSVVVVAVALLCQHRLRQRQKELQLDRDEPIRKSTISNHSNATRVTVLSGGGPRLSSSRSSGGELGQRSEPRPMQRSVSEEVATRSRRATDFTARWCTEHGLSEHVAAALRTHGFVSRATLDSLKPGDVPSLGLASVAQECLLRAALEDRARTGSSSSGATARQRSSSEELLAGPPPPPHVSSGDARVPLLDRARSHIDLAEMEETAFTGNGLKSKKGYERSYEVMGDDSVFPTVPSVISLQGSKPHIGRSPSEHLFNGLLSDRGLYELCGLLGMDWPHLATLLGVPPPVQDQIRHDNPYNTKQQIWEVLRLWRDGAEGSKEEVKGQLHRALTRVHRVDIAERLMQEQVDGSVERVTVQSIV